MSTSTNSPETKSPKILVFSTDKISDPGIDQAGLRKIHYAPSVYVISVPCSSGIKPKWILHALESGFDGVFIAADGHECSYSSRCADHTNTIVETSQVLMKEKNIKPSRQVGDILGGLFEKVINKELENDRDILLEELRKG